MKLNQQRLAIFLLSVRYCNVSATGDTTLGDLKRIFKFDLNEPPPLETDDTSPEENSTKDLIDNSHERAVGINPDLANVAAQYSRPISRPAIQTSDLEMLDYRSNRPQGVILGGPQEDDPDHPKSRGFPTRKAKTRLLTDLYQPEDVWGKSDPRSRSMRSPFKALSSKNINISSVVDLKTSEPATTSRTTEAEAKEDYPQASPKPRESTANFDRKRKSKMELTRISSMESKDKEIAISRVSKTQSAAKSSKEKELPNKSLGLTSSGGRLLGGSGIRDRNHMRMQKKLKYRNEDDDPEYDPQETDAVIPEISLRNSMEDHKFQTDSDEEIRDINKESQLQKQAKLRRDVVDWYRDNGFSIPRTAEKFSICYKTVRRYVDAAKALERQGASATSSTTEKKNILNGVTLIRYPDKFKRWAVKYYFEHGLSQEKTAQALEIPRGSLACWLTRFPFLKPGSTQKMVENNNIIRTIHKKQRNSMEDHKFQTDSDEEIRDMNKESQLQKQAKLRRDVVDWYRNNGFSVPRTAEKFSICYKTVRKYVDAAKALERQGASATSSTTEKKNILNGVTLLRYPDNFKRWAVKYYFEHGLGQEKTAQALGIPRGSLACWLTRYSFLKPGSTQKMVENNNIIGTIHKKHTVIKPRKKQIKGVRRGPLNSTSA